MHLCIVFIGKIYTSVADTEETWSHRVSFSSLLKRTQTHTQYTYTSVISYMHGAHPIPIVIIWSKHVNTKQNNTTTPNKLNILFRSLLIVNQRCNSCYTGVVVVRISLYIVWMSLVTLGIKHKFLLDLLAGSWKLNYCLVNTAWE